METDLRFRYFTFNKEMTDKETEKLRETFRKVKQEMLEQEVKEE